MSPKTKDAKIDWKKFWERMDTWYQSRCDSPSCKTCGHRKHDEPEWEDQQRWIQKEINRLVAKNPSGDS